MDDLPTIEELFEEEEESREPTAGNESIDSCEDLVENPALPSAIATRGSHGIYKPNPRYVLMATEIPISQIGISNSTMEVSKTSLTKFILRKFSRNFKQKLTEL